jgi:hypothetical protein
VEAFADDQAFRVDDYGADARVWVAQRSERCERQGATHQRNIARWRTHLRLTHVLPLVLGSMFRASSGARTVHTDFMAKQSDPTCPHCV